MSDTFVMFKLARELHARKVNAKALCHCVVILKVLTPSTIQAFIYVSTHVKNIKKAHYNCSRSVFFVYLS